jgi:hypothetical protein
MKLSKRCRQLVEQWLEEIAREYPQVRFEGLTKTPDGAVAIKLRGPEDLLEQVRISFAPRKLEALLKHLCHIIFLCLAEPPLNPDWDYTDFGDNAAEVESVLDEVYARKGGQKNGGSD